MFLGGKSRLVKVSHLSMNGFTLIHAHSIHGTGIFTYIDYMVNAGKYTSPMDPMGCFLGARTFFGFFWKKQRILREIQHFLFEPFKRFNRRHGSV